MARDKDRPPSRNNPGIPEIRPKTRSFSFEDLPPIAREEIQEEFHRYVEGSTPPPRLEAVERRVREQVADHPSGIHNVEELQRLLEMKLEQAAAERLADKQRELQEARHELARVRDKAEADLREERRLASERVAKLEDRKQERWSRKWALIATLVTLLATALITRYVGAPSGVPQETPVPVTTPE